MKYQYSPDNKIIIKCSSCLNKLKVPLDKGKISVTCPVCGKVFLYNPDSILDTLKQIVISIRAYVARSKRNKIIFLGVVLAVILALVLLVLLMKRNKVPLYPL